MEKKVELLNWRDGLVTADADSLGNDFILVDNPVIMPALFEPFKLDITVCAICIEGSAAGSIDQKRYEFKSPGMVIAIAGQILQYESFSDDFSGQFIVMSRKFTDDLNIEERLPLFLAIRDNPYFPLTEEELESIMMYFKMMRKAIRRSDNPHRIEIARHLTKAFFYGAGYHFHKLLGDSDKSKQDILVQNFLDLVQQNFREHRNTDFYAGKLCLTPKYLSVVVKKTSGKSAAEWIDSYVVLEAKALLKSTNKTIQQISDELNFPSQSFFGKYFKRITGISPKEYRNR